MRKRTRYILRRQRQTTWDLRTTVLFRRGEAACYSLVSSAKGKRRDARSTRRSDVPGELEIHRSTREWSPIQLIMRLDTGLSAHQLRKNGEGQKHTLISKNSMNLSSFRSGDSKIALTSPIAPKTCASSASTIGPRALGTLSVKDP